MLHVVDLHYVGDKYMVETGRVFVVLCMCTCVSISLECQTVAQLQAEEQSGHTSLVSHGTE